MSEQPVPNTQKIDLDQYGSASSVDQDFVPEPRFHPGRSTKIMGVVLIFVLGLGLGAVTVHSIDSAGRTTRPAINGNFGGRNSTGNSTTGTDGNRPSRYGG